jgi:C-terminal processing protease CtpA/Prc
MKKSFYIFTIFLTILSFQSKAQTITENTYYKRLYYTAKVWGYLKYFHSNVAKGFFNWDEKLISTIKKIKTDNDDEEFNKTLLSLIKNAGKPSYTNTTLPIVPDSLKFNLNLTWLQASLFSDSVKLLLNEIKTKFRPQKNNYVNYVPGVGNPTFDTDKQFYKFGSDEYPDEQHRLLTLFRYWNIINYFYPYKNIIDQDWDSTLVEFIPKFINSNNTRSFHFSFLTLTTRLNDSHAVAYSKEINVNILGKYFLPLVLKYVENETVVTKVLQNNNQIKIGDVIKSIDGIDINIVRDSLKTYTVGSNISRINYNINARIIRGDLKDVTLLIENSEGQKEITLSRNIFYSDYYKTIIRTDNIWKIINSKGRKIGYVDMGRLEKNDISTMFNDLWNTDAIIFDIRNYPKGTMWYMVEYFFNKPITIASFTKPIVNYPGTLYWVNINVGRHNSTPSYEKPIVILFDESTQSQAEYTIMAFEQHPKAIKIGSQTSGADGNVSKIYLPGGILAYFTGLGTFYPDHTPTQRIGIVPDIKVLPTIEGIREGKDELLEEAINYSITNVNQNINSEIPKTFILAQNYPNPFNPTTVIKYQIPKNKRGIAVNVNLSIYNILGENILTLVNKKQKPGYYKVTWNAQNYPSGIYFYKINANGFAKTKKMVLLR